MSGIRLSKCSIPKCVTGPKDAIHTNPKKNLRVDLCCRAHVLQNVGFADSREVFGIGITRIQLNSALIAKPIPRQSRGLRAKRSRMN